VDQFFCVREDDPRHQHGSVRGGAGIAGNSVASVLRSWNEPRPLPLTDIAARYTDDRAANSDISLPLWLARHNKAVSGSLCLMDVAFLAWRFWG
jgi:hypothetical protein